MKSMKSKPLIWGISVLFSLSHPVENQHPHPPLLEFFDSLNFAATCRAVKTTIHMWTMLQFKRKRVWIIQFRVISSFHEARWWAWFTVRKRDMRNSTNTKCSVFNSTKFLNPIKREDWGRLFNRYLKFTAQVQKMCFLFLSRGGRCRQNGSDKVKWKRKQANKSPTGQRGKQIRDHWDQRTLKVTAGEKREHAGLYTRKVVNKTQVEDVRAGRKKRGGEVKHYKTDTDRTTK